MNLTNLKNIAADFEALIGIPCEVSPMPINMAATHIKLEYIGKERNLDSTSLKNGYGQFSINLVLRGDGYNEKINDEVCLADWKLTETFDDQIIFDDSDYNYCIEPGNVIIEDIGWLNPEQVNGILDPDPMSNDSGSRQIFTRVFRLKINYTTKN